MTPGALAITFFFVTILPMIILLWAAYRDAKRAEREVPAEPAIDGEPPVFLVRGAALPDHITGEERATRERQLDILARNKAVDTMSRHNCWNLDDASRKKLYDEFVRAYRADYGLA